MTRLIVTRRRPVRRFQRVETLDGNGPLVEVTDHVDSEGTITVPEEISDLEGYVQSLARMDPTIQEVRVEGEPRRD